MAAIVTQDGVPGCELYLGDEVPAPDICAGLIGGQGVGGAGALDAQVAMAWKVVAVCLETIIDEELCSANPLRLGNRLTCVSAFDGVCLTGAG